MKTITDNIWCRFFVVFCLTLYLFLILNIIPSLLPCLLHPISFVWFCCRFGTRSSMSSHNKTVVGRWHWIRISISFLVTTVLKQPILSVQFFWGIRKLGNQKTFEKSSFEVLLLVWRQRRWNFNSVFCILFKKVCSRKLSCYWSARLFFLKPLALGFLKESFSRIWTSFQTYFSSTFKLFHYHREQLL